MKKRIRARGVQSIDKNWIPYTNYYGSWVWAPNENAMLEHWPGSKAPDWVTRVIYEEGTGWMWSDGKE